MKWFKNANVLDICCFSLLVLALILVAIQLVLIPVGVYVTIKENQNKVVCVNSGYPELLVTPNGYYCHKLENGNDVIVSVESLRDGK